MCAVAIKPQRCSHIHLSRTEMSSVYPKTAFFYTCSGDQNPYLIFTQQTLYQLSYLLSSQSLILTQSSNAWKWKALYDIFQWKSKWVGSQRSKQQLWLTAFHQTTYFKGFSENPVPTFLRTLVCFVDLLWGSYICSRFSCLSPKGTL